MSAEPTSYRATPVVAGTGQGRALLLGAPLSFWGGYDAQAGRIVEPGHPQQGMSLAGRVLLMAHAKGSSSSSSVLAEAIRQRTGPAAIVMCSRDLIIGVGCIVASELYGRHVPIAAVDEATWLALSRLPDGLRLRVEVDDERGSIVSDHRA
ncbi:aconitase X swivel domain-containing protein [Verminephrobacter eiseniae]|uniref:aconitase X swivel domain-containing protein n=1 Tax=Verminephrobacter eiseniae TaxID=364317 RepID=UPI0010DF90A0|nr:DUF126 domain-containing protein [Verminephrobacter eiseniae]KAB7597335.1 DUF126 domain-containing protein [Verminephrobacter sp. Larva24]MCW5232410.1 DUF126 domain-containing protein [Verminephrobacter eiseniae]MCW5296024.1 DUF126 domain-containing protein [Verminephrobacter eiseniae]MCW8187814.1 DUF126 domain-containing protein [Verminephrobacter eiseniae]MCW8226122.1 DUF126 domain-containing protein [Verminephrobacter eiseniae]